MEKKKPVKKNYNVALVNKHLIATLLDYLKVNFFVIDEEGFYISRNSTLTDVVGEVAKADRVDNKAWVSCQEVMRTKQRQVVEEQYQDHWYLSVKMPLIENNKVLDVIGIAIDITDRKHVEEREKLALAQAAEERAKAKAEAELRQAVMVLAGSIAHDLRTPIAILGMNGYTIKKLMPSLMDTYQKAKAAQLAIESIPAFKLDALEELGDEIADTTQQMQEFINVTLKTLSKVLRGELAQKDLVPCSMWHCIHNTLTRYPFSGGQRALIKWDQQDFSFMGNELLMIRVFSNLLNNSLQQIEKNQGGEIFISTEESDTLNTLRFKDTAGGASPEVAVHLFDGYHTTKKDGTGVGLAFCKLTMKNFGGNITCNSVYGDYMEFVLSFPKLTAA